MIRRSKKTPKELGMEHQVRKMTAPREAKSQRAARKMAERSHMPGLKALRVRDMSKSLAMTTAPTNLWQQRPASAGQRHLRQVLRQLQLEIPAREADGRRYRSGGAVARAAAAGFPHREGPAQPQGHDQQMLVDEPWHHVRYQDPR